MTDVGLEQQVAHANSGQVEGGFDALAVPPEVCTLLSRLGYRSPTQIQSIVVPLILAGKDVLGASQTGSGKTAAFMIPIASLLLGGRPGDVLIMAPTRELVVQIALFVRKFMGNSRELSVATLIGGEHIVKQFIQLERRPAPRIIIGTPGRITDHMKRGKLSVSNTRFLVLDETDRMLDMGFSEQISYIIDQMPKDRQSMMFSATLPPNIVEMSKRYMSSPEIVRVGSDSVPAKNIEQKVLNVTEHTKYDELLKELDKREGSVIIFVKTKSGASELADRLVGSFYSTSCIHGDLRQNKRDKAIKDFRNMKCRIMVATDVASRGLDIPHIAHVINYDLPQCVEDYIHRVGRTARAGAVGCAAVFVTPADKSRWDAIDRIISGKVNDKRNPLDSCLPPQRRYRKSNTGGKKSYFANGSHRGYNNDSRRREDSRQGFNKLSYRSRSHT